MNSPVIHFSLFFCLSCFLYGVCVALPEEVSLLHVAGPRGAIDRASDSKVRGPGFDTRSGNILSLLLPLFQEEQLSTGESMCMKYWLTA